LLRELIEAPADLRPALKGALGSFGDAVVYANADDAIESAGHAGGDGVLLGVAGLVTIAALPPAEGGTRRLLDHVRVDGRVSGLAAALLGNVFVVSNLAEAAARHRVRPGAQFVTPDGTVVGSGFVRTPAQHDVRLEAIRREEAGIERDLALVRRDLREARIGMGALADRAAAGRRDVERIDGLITAAADEMAQVQKEVASLERERQVLSERGALVDAALEAITARLGELPPGPTDAEPAPVSAEAPHDLRVEVESLRRERSRLEAEAGRIQAEIEAAEGEDPGALSTVLGQAERERAAAEEVLRAGEDGYARTSAAFRAAAEGARSAAAALGEANRSWRAASSELDRVRDEHEQEDMARADLDRRIEDAERTLVEGHGVHPGVALGTVDPADTVEDLRRQSELVARKLGLLGRVNLLATGELESLKERHDFLSRELEDVRSAWRDLERVIEDVDRQMADLFEMAFRDVAREFSSLFAHLFPGGEGRLTLIDPADPLASGIEVEARPGRKKVRRLSLLSGGERSLAALAFLFAIFRARPSPFYLMDEVEAALDDVNLHRFLEIVKEFAKESQIIVVTHQKRTMEMADVLYGVSMGQDGASAVISQRLAEVETVDAGS